MSFRCFAAVMLGVLVTACATPTPAPPAILEYARSDCASSPALAGAIELTPPHERAEFDVTTLVDGQTACVGDAASATPYVVYALPADFSDKTITVGALVEPARIFAATVVLLDSNGAVTRALGADQFAYRGGVYSMQFRPHQGEAYLVVEADRTVVGRSYNSITIGTATATGCGPGACMNWSYGTEARQSATFSYTGAIQVQVFDSVVGARTNAQQATH